MMILEEKEKAKMIKGKARKEKEKGLSFPKDVVRPQKKENPFAMHSIVSSVRMPRMGSDARGVFMCAGNVSGLNHMPPAHMSD